MTINSCICCDHKDITIQFNNSFFNSNIRRCKNCSYMFNDVSKEEVDSFLKNYYKNEYWQIKRKQRSNFFLRLISKISSVKLDFQRAYSQFNYIKKTRGNVLDVGAGRGTTSIFFAKRNFQVISIEPDKKNAEKLRKINLSIQVHNGSLDDFKNEGRLFDIVVLSHVLEHAYNILDFLKIIKKLLTENGIIFVEVPNCNNNATLERSIMTEPHLSHFTKKSLENLFCKLGMKIVKLESVYYGYCDDSLLHQAVRSLKFLIFRRDIYKNSSNGKGDAYRVIVKL